MVAQVAQAVGAAHAAGIVHRDLKPDNVFLSISNTDGRIVPKVLDFGIAKLAERGSATHTRTGAVLGTPAYMSPEQCRGGSKVVDGRSDVYSLGCILYEMLCGTPPFVRDGMGDLIVAHVSEAPEPPHARVPTIPPALDALVMRMLAKASDRSTADDGRGRGRAHRLPGRAGRARAARPTFARASRWSCRCCRIIFPRRR